MLEAFLVGFFYLQLCFSARVMLQMVEHNPNVAILKPAPMFSKASICNTSLSPKFIFLS